MKMHFKSVEEVLKENDVTKSGLSTERARVLLEKNGKNKLAEAKKRSLFLRVLDQVRDPMVIVLIAAAIISGVFKETADMVIIFIVVAINAVLGIVQEGKAEKAIEILQKMSAPHAKVRRDNNISVIDTEEIVVGDIVIIESGDSIPADLRLIETSSLKCEEAALTGESTPVEKNPSVIEYSERETPLGDRYNMAYMGTSAVYGRGEGVVIATGMKTEMGKIAGALAVEVDEKTPLQRKLAQLSKVLSFAVLGISIFIFLFSVLRSGGQDGNLIFDALLTAISLAVAAIPEGLVVVVTVVLSIGITKMSKKNAIVRKLTAVETLGCTQVICSDKTGTLTQNKMTVVESFGDENLLGLAMYCCNDVEKDSEGNYVGDPTQIAQIEYGERAVGTPEMVRIFDIPFDSERKMMTTFNLDNEGNYYQFTTGAPDVILSKCTRILINGTANEINESKMNLVTSENKKMAEKALRVLGAAYKVFKSEPEETSPEAAENDMVFLGLVGMIDPIRPEVLTAINECKSAGIKAVMITGDHKDTAVAIAKSLGILTNERQAVTGVELSEMSDEEFSERIRDISVYARVKPEHKVRIVNMWKSLGKVTAMTGDGVNDAPAIKNADIGIGMGITGTDVTKNVADMVLADDNFATIVLAIEEGRRIYENIRKSIQFLLASNLSEVIAIFVATVFGFKLFAPIHILWINLITDTFPAISLGMEEIEPDAMKKKPRDQGENIFSNQMGLDIIWQGLLIAVLTLVSYFIGSKHNQLTGMTMAFMTLSLCEIFHSFNLRSRDKSIIQLKSKNNWLVGAMLLSLLLTLTVIYIPGLNVVFRLTSLTFNEIIICIGLSFSVIPIVEIVKVFKRIYNKNLISRG
ncbi:MAG: cation-translocating P-type ATPase [Ruminococcaceae bacterium]|nr:cation-translocating P-type ATPase [Oscillospiraceae bacterium]